MEGKKDSDVWKVSAHAFIVILCTANQGEYHSLVTTKTIRVMIDLHVEIKSVSRPLDIASNSPRLWHTTACVDEHETVAFYQLP